VQQTGIDTLVVFGGDTAHAILQSLECGRVDRSENCCRGGVEPPGIGYKESCCWSAKPGIWRTGHVASHSQVVKRLTDLMKPIGITMGDASGVGPELFLPRSSAENASSIVLFGDMAALELIRQAGKYVCLRTASYPGDLQEGVLNV
jgi:hypothetical protein